jgi:hypothetical protein
MVRSFDEIAPITEGIKSFDDIVPSTKGIKSFDEIVPQGRGTSYEDIFGEAKDTSDPIGFIEAQT